MNFSWFIIKSQMPKRAAETKSKNPARHPGSFFGFDSLLSLNDGTEFHGTAFGDTSKIASGEVVFHTGMCGYQEVLSDPSYAGQIVVFTYPHIGNYGVNDEDYESKKYFVRGVITRDIVDDYSNFRAQRSLNEELKKHGIFGLSGIDTRQLTRHIREHGAVPGAMGLNTQDIKAEALKAKTTDGIDLVRTVTTKKTYTAGSGNKTIVAFDFGMKQSIVDELAQLGKVVVVPANTSADEVMKHSPTGVFLSNGPGDPSAVSYASDTIKELLGKVPIFGICLGHQLLATALGGKTRKLRFGHHSANHPVKDHKTGEVEITSQNHNYEVVADSIQDVEITHTNLNDQVVEGLESKKLKAFSVQYHPEAAPGPNDSKYLFKRFEELMNA